MSGGDLVVISAEQLRLLLREAVNEVLAARNDGGSSEVLTRDEAAALLKVHPAVVTRYVRTRGLPGRKIGRDWRFKRAEVLAWLATMGRAA